MRSTFLFLFSTILVSMLLGCSSYKTKKQESQLVLPELGNVVQTQGDMFYSTVEPAGIPSWPTLKVELQQMPFNTKSYTTYARLMQRAARINSISYNDSLPYKPKYVRLQLTDKVALTQMLNSEAHESLREYLTADDAYKLVTGLDLALSESELVVFLNAEAVQLQKDEYGSLKVVLINGNQQNSFFFSELQVFDYQLSSFCWGEDVLHRKKIKNLIAEGERCPKGTFLKARKMEKDESYLKF
ncbi:hypothetical protein [Flagellimonas allohymeniacidonis]|uniref:Lipoprotein n=1 Tax=Flagellimonas allohymeniacidonis TaxID=2517819 RepID=A0A4Q8QFL6_9FLAO|nr:hypothetical protein [Allomuricauda hymeniacidonis]TAI48497.1 hypothetical protein EW142_01445 [Allomuricauda hymeniacidonis]